MKKKPQILFASFEAAPFMKTGGLGDVAGSLPKALCSAGANVRLILPKFGTIPEKYRSKMKHIAEFTVPLSWRNQYCGIDYLRTNGVTCYFIDNEFYFKRDKAYGYGDDDERCAFFSKAVLECLPHLPNFDPKIIHCNDWHTALIPVFLNAWYRENDYYRNLRTIFTIHNLKFQGACPKFVSSDILGLSEDKAERLGLIRGDSVNFLKGALCNSDLLTTVSPTYAEEICTDFYGENMSDIFLSRKNVLFGILNGIDTDKYNPETDPAIISNYNVTDISPKYKNKEFLQEKLGLPVNSEIPMIAVISRLTEQKGLDLLLRILDELLFEDIQLVILGIGDKKYENAFRAAEYSHNNRMRALLYFDENFSHLVYSAADIVLVPSLFEPCGLSQMIAMRYGSLPVVRETGGLRDSVSPYNVYTGEGTGFSFSNYNAHELLFTIKNALRIYWDDHESWEKLMQQAMSRDFSWSASAKEYMSLYSKLL